MTRAPAPHRMIDILARETVVHYAPVPRHLGEAELVPGRCALIGDQFSLIAPAEEMLWLNGSVYAAIASIHGLLPIHASAVACEGAVHAFTRPSGAGKST